jgi:hypothetical protein
MPFALPSKPRASRGTGTGAISLAVAVDYVPGEPVEVFARKRGPRWDFGDCGRAVQLAGKPTGWLAAAERVVAEEGMNVDRAGVVFVPAFERPCRDLAALVLRLGDVSHAVTRSSSSSSEAPLAAAAADRLAEVAALELQVAAAARRREDLRVDEHGAGDDRPGEEGQEREGKRDLPRHGSSIGRARPSD